VSIFKRKNQLPRQLALGNFQDAMGRVEDALRDREPPHIYNPSKGTRYHYRDPDQAAARPVCKASGAGWAEGDGGLRECGNCPGMWAQRQERSEDRAAS
jgi:hypothetical protein